MQHPTRAFAVFARVVNEYLEVYETMRGSKKLTLRAPMGREKQTYMSGFSNPQAENVPQRYSARGRFLMLYPDLRG
jgi:hypothetical protein